MPFDKFFTFSHFSYMQKLFAILVVASAMSVTSAFAAELPTATTVSGANTTTTVAPPSQTAPLPSPQENTVQAELNAAPATAPATAPAAVVASMGSSLGEYKAVACTTNPAYSVNSCNQCFVG
jgi:hypothetical protein